MTCLSMSINRYINIDKSFRDIDKCLPFINIGKSFIDIGKDLSILMNRPINISKCSMFIDFGNFSY